MSVHGKVYEGTARTADEYQEQIKAARAAIIEKLGDDAFVHAPEFLAATTTGVKYVLHGETGDIDIPSLAYATVLRLL